jgi:hypothetical protein
MHLRRNHYIQLTQIARPIVHGQYLSGVPGCLVCGSRGVTKLNRDCMSPLFIQPRYSVAVSRYDSPTRLRLLVCRARWRRAEVVRGDLFSLHIITQHNYRSLQPLSHLTNKRAPQGALHEVQARRMNQASLAANDAAVVLVGF